MTSMTPLVTLLLLGLLLAVVLVLLAWAIVHPGVRSATSRRQATAAGQRGSERATRRRSREDDDPWAAEREFESPAAAAPVSVRRSNDELRGAKATRSAARPPNDDDPFERFLRAGRDDDR